ncbi:hypothetical protein RvY_14009 [Ramazzottius varieornatus]|uniref:Uncharacterized protein n=1 Tax=Ramazzottius varieornatus TaxID=947166 RepID=A0A1D1VTS2_RAMVA|nr:hypothetical protein RvY_14009 [Ramazzottius varieornatus]
MNKLERTPTWLTEFQKSSLQTIEAYVDCLAHAFLCTLPPELFGILPVEGYTPEWGGYTLAGLINTKTAK